jgi:hypothetical protein
MVKPETIAVPLPIDVQPTEIDLELLRATFQAVIALRYECKHDYECCLKRLKNDGWKVHWKLSWVAEAKRGEDYEQASGDSVGAALSQLYQLTRLDMVGGCP